jgi:hypothetical protein
MKARRFLLFLAFAAFWGGCSRGCSGGDSGSGARPTASVSASPPVASASAAAAAGGDDEIRPVYPNTNDPPDPLAGKLCEALHGVPVKRRAACCAHGAGFSLEGECTRTLSFALREKAVTVDPAAVDACAAAMARAHEGCAWVGPTGAPLPAECDGIVRGTLEEGKRCRSSLECVDGLRCQGVGPTDMGQCAKPKGRGHVCAIAVDTLASFTRQDGFDERHPECAGYCSHRRCDDFVAVGGACKTRAQCGPGKICAGGKCAEGALPGEGEACVSGACAKGLRCAGGKCAAPKKEGEACENDAECLGGCVRGDGGKKGTCGMKCSAL